MSTDKIRSIYEEYFSIIESYFGCMKRYLSVDEDSHVELGIEVANYPLVSDLIFDTLYSLEEDIRLFWQENAKVIFTYIKSKDTLKCLYSGNITPHNLENFIKRSALYIDNVIVPDPIFNLTRPGLRDYMDKYYYLSKIIQHIFNVWKLRRMIENSTVDILYILPISLEALGNKRCEKLLAKADGSYLKYYNLATNGTMESTEDVSKSLIDIDSTNGILTTFRKSNMLPSALRTPNSLSGFFDSFRRGIVSPGKKTLGEYFDNYLRSQFIRVQEHRYFCSVLAAEPIYDYEPPWHFFTSVMGGSGIDGAIVSALHTEPFQWISKVPIQALVVFREEEELSYMRSILRKGITDLKAKSDHDLSVVSKQLQENLQEAFFKQDSEIRVLESKVKTITGKELPITASGFFAGFIPVVNYFISLAFAGRDVKKLLEEKKETEAQLEEKRGSYINLLMRTKKD